MRRDAFNKTLVVLYFVSFAVLLYFLVTGTSYYLAPLQERPRHEAYWALKPGGATGHALGIFGSALMILMLLYSVRKRVPGLRRFGAPRLWLQFHILCGIVGPLFVILHSSFKVQGLVALSFWSMIIVALSGFVGRYLYVQMPRRRSGDEMTLAEVEALNRQLGRRLAEEFQLSKVVLEELEMISTSTRDDTRHLFRIVLTLPWESLTLQWRLRKFQRSSQASRHPLFSELRKVVRQKAYLERRIRLWDELHRLFYYWHVFHKPFAVIMYLFMIVHVAVAIVTGYSGGFGK